MTNEGLRQLVTRLASRGVSIDGARLDRHDLERLTVPDSAAARAAEELATSAQPSCARRTTACARTRGARCSASPSRARSRARSSTSPRCSTTSGCSSHTTEATTSRQTAPRLRRAARSVGWDAERADRAAHAIRDHWNGPENEDEVESLLLAYGTSVDVGGWRVRSSTTDTFDDVVATAPRDGFKQQFIELVEQQAEAKPWCHLSRWRPTPAFAERVLAAPFDS